MSGESKLLRLAKDVAAQYDITLDEAVDKLRENLESVAGPLRVEHVESIQDKNLRPLVASLKESRHTLGLALNAEREKNERMTDMLVHLFDEVVRMELALRGMFEPLKGRSIKERCVVCGATGYPNGKWKEPHQRGHAFCTRGCGTMLPVLSNGAPRTHPRCPR